LQFLGAGVLFIQKEIFMPPLTGERFQPTPPSHEELAQEAKFHDLLTSTYERMNQLLPMPTGSRDFHTYVYSAETSYHADESQEDVLTRAWLIRGTGRFIRGEETSIHVITAKSVQQDGEIARIPGSQIDHFSVSRDGTFETEHYVGATTSQKIELMESVQDTLTLIEAASAVAIPKVTN
jgi:hypothetical protein